MFTAFGFRDISTSTAAARVTPAAPAPSRVFPWKGNNDDDDDDGDNGLGSRECASCASVVVVVIAATGDTGAPLLSESAAVAVIPGTCSGTVCK